MASLWVNLIYRILITSVLASSGMFVIRLFDGLGFEIHFMRFAYWTLIDSVNNTFIVYSLGWDVHLLCVIIPLQLAALKFLCNSPDVSYDSRINAFAAPLAVFSFFYFSSFDVLYMGI